MADVFISYAREDRARADQVARGLAALGLESFWDSEIPPGQTWADYTEEKLTSCKVVVVLWSQHSTKSHWVREEARMGRDKAKLIPAMIDNVPMPFGFGEVQAANLSTWQGESQHPDWMRFTQAVYRAARGGEAPAPPPAAPQWTPPPQAPPPSSAQSGGWSIPQPPPQRESWTQAREASAAGLRAPLFYVKKCLRQFADGAGRARRAEYWWWLLFGFLLSVIAYGVDAQIFGADPYTSIPYQQVASAIVGLALLAPSVSVTSRRLHDFGMSGWFAGAITAALTIGSAFPTTVLGGLVSLAALIAVIGVGVAPATPGPNRYGPNPRG